METTHSDHLLDPDTPLRNPEHINHPANDDPAVPRVHTGNLEVSQETVHLRLPRAFLPHTRRIPPLIHHKQPRLPRWQNPVFSLFLPACTLGPPFASGVRSHQFHMEQKDGVGLFRKTFGRSAGGYACTFRARSREDIVQWWIDVRMLCTRYLVASEQMEGSGPVVAGGVCQ
jgi:hypothetical protein